MLFFARPCRVSELPVIDKSGCPSGLIDIVDLVGGDLAESSRDSSSTETDQCRHSSAARKPLIFAEKASFQ